MTREYTSGDFCINIACAHHSALDGLKDEEYFNKKKSYCKDCYAWRFYQYLLKNQWKILKVMPDMSTKELAARIKGISPDEAENLTVDEILSL